MILVFGFVMLTLPLFFARLVVGPVPFIYFRMSGDRCGSGRPFPPGIRTFLEESLFLIHTDIHPQGSIFQLQAGFLIVLFVVFTSLKCVLCSYIFIPLEHAKSLRWEERIDHDLCHGR